MSQADFFALAEYSCSTPSGVYPGKMWKHNNYAYRPAPPGIKEQWFLRWFGVSEKGPEWCSNEHREILIA